MKALLVLFLFIIISSCAPSTGETKSRKWCDHVLRKEFSQLQEKKIKRPWFKVYEVSNSVYAIYEPFSFQEVISYLILGTEKALLFDSGNGIDSIELVVKELTDLPVTVLNSHTHYDHIGGNVSFDAILGMNSDYTRQNAENGWSHSTVHGEVTVEAICLETIPGFDTSSYHIRPYQVTEYIQDGYKISLGNRTLEVLAAPGHTDDAIALWDEAEGLLWTGDTFYEATIWLFFPGTDLQAYERTVNKLSALSPQVKKILPAHNFPLAKPERLSEWKTAFYEVLAGKIKGDSLAKDQLKFSFTNFSFLIRKDLLRDDGAYK